MAAADSELLADPGASQQQQQQQQPDSPQGSVAASVSSPLPPVSSPPPQPPQPSPKGAAAAIAAMRAQLGGGRPVTAALPAFLELLARVALLVFGVRSGCVALPHHALLGRGGGGEGAWAPPQQQQPSPSSSSPSSSSNPVPLVGAALGTEVALALLQYLDAKGGREAMARSSARTGAGGGAQALRFAARSEFR